MAERASWGRRLGAWVYARREAAKGAGVVVPSRPAVQLLLSVGGMALLCVAGLLVNVVLGVAAAGLSCFVLERRIAR